MDTRVSVDVTLTIPQASIIEVVDQTEGRVKVLARFPLKDYQDEYIEAGETYDSYTLRETQYLGIEDLTRGNYDSNSSLLLPGEFQQANLLVEVRYLENKQFKRVPAVFGRHGFWNLKLLFAKKTK